MVYNSQISIDRRTIAEPERPRPDLTSRPDQSAELRAHFTEPQFLPGIPRHVQ